VEFDWGSTPNCRGTDPEVFFSSEKYSDTRRTALALCKGCPTKRSCLEFALDNHEAGIWGGTTEEERRIMRLFRQALTPIPSRHRDLLDTPPLREGQTVQVSMSISYSSTLQQLPASPTPSSELNLSELRVPCTRGPSRTWNPPRVAVTSPSPSLNLAALACS